MLFLTVLLYFPTFCATFLQPSTSSLFFNSSASLLSLFYHSPQNHIFSHSLTTSVHAFSYLFSQLCPLFVLSIPRSLICFLVPTLLSALNFYTFLASLLCFLTDFTTLPQPHTFSFLTLPRLYFLSFTTLFSHSFSHYLTTSVHTFSFLFSHVCLLSVLFLYPALLLFLVPTVLLVLNFYAFPYSFYHFATTLHFLPRF